MKKVFRRALAALLLTAVLLGGTGFFLVRYFVVGEEWVTFPGSPHVYKNGVLRNAVVKGADGQVLLTLDGSRDYGDDQLQREAFLHLLGDRSGNIDAPIVRYYSSQFAGYRPLWGVYRMDSEPVTMGLALSTEVQKTAYRLLNGRKGTIAVYNYVNGEILCAVSSPAYDPDNMPDVLGNDTDAFEGIYVNRFTNSVYVPGSIFKIVTAACALDTMPRTLMTRKFSCDGALEVGEDVVTCNAVHGEITLSEALAKSCNCVFGVLAMELGEETLQSYVNEMGLTERAVVDGVETMAGRFELEGASLVDLAWSGIGQHTVMINPYSFLRFVGAIAGNGTAAEPHFVQEVGSYRAKVRTFDLDMGKDTTQVLREYMANNVKTVYGTGNFPPVTVCAKSGTAEVGEGQRPHATFAGFVDDASYPLAFILVVENGGSGSQTCARMAGEVLSACMEFMDLAATKKY